jgi:hypothetical protein
MGSICSKCCNCFEEKFELNNLDKAKKSYNHNNASNNSTIRSKHNFKGNNPHISSPNTKLLKLRIRDLNLNEIISLEFEDTSPIEELREKLTEKFSKTKIHHLLYHQTKITSGTLKDYGVRDGSLIDIVGERIGNWAI